VLAPQARRGLGPKSEFRRWLDGLTKRRWRLKSIVLDSVQPRGRRARHNARIFDCNIAGCAVLGSNLTSQPSCEDIIIYSEVQLAASLFE
jgi:hypothetical protein